MSDLPIPKYSIGDTVWYASAYTGAEQLPCPDCLGQKLWSVTSPAGGTFQVNCVRCSGSGYLEAHTYEPQTRSLTIGSIQIDTANTSDNHREVVQYMCKETGIGSGSVYRESLLFRSQEEAEPAAAALAKSRIDEMPDRWKQQQADFRRLAKYQLRDAAIKEAEDKAYESERRHGRLLERVCDLDMYPVSGEPFNSSTSLTEEQRNAVQESLVWLEERDAEALLEYRRGAAE